MINVMQMYEDILSKCRSEVESRKTNGYPIPKLNIIQVGNNSASNAYVKGKLADAESIGIRAYLHKLISVDSIYEISDAVKSCSKPNEYTIVQLPLPDNIQGDDYLRKLSPTADVDGFLADSPYPPCTPEGVIYILKNTLPTGSLEDKNILVIGRGRLVGRPLTKMLLAENANVMVAHSKTSDESMQQLMHGADIIVSAIGIPHHFTREMLRRYGVRNDVIIVDCGTSKDPETGKLCGDFQPDCRELQTPAPGGVGLMTRAMLMKHVVFADEYTK